MAEARDLIRRVGASALLVVLGLSGISYVAPAAASSLSRCQETQIDVDIVSRGAALGNVGDAIVITNVSSSACTVTGYPTVRFTGGSGRRGVRGAKDPERVHRRARRPGRQTSPSRRDAPRPRRRGLELDRG